MKVNRILGALAGALMVSGIAASVAAEQYQFRQQLKGLTPPSISEPTEPSEPDAPIELSTATLPDAKRGLSYSFEFADLLTPAGTSDVTWAISSRPAWGELNAETGAFAGIPSASDVGTKNFTVIATRGSQKSQKAYTIVVAGEALEVVDISAGAYHTCAVTPAGAAKCWGANESGQLGDNTTTDRLIPTQVVGLTSGVASISAGSNHTCVLTTSGGVRCWGANAFGQIGNNQTSNRLTPNTVTGLSSGAKAVSAGHEHTCAINSAGSALCWGRGSYGQLGSGSTAQQLTPTQVSGLTSGVAEISAAFAHTCARTTAGAVKCWGNNANFQLGDRSNKSSNIPVQVYTLNSGVKRIATGMHTSCAILSTGAAKCWGYGVNGQIGDGATANRSGPSQVAGLTSGVTEIDLGTHHACALQSNGTMHCWGNNGGKLGTGNGTSSNYPVPVLDLPAGTTKISAGQTVTCAISGLGAAWCWGSGIKGQLGMGANGVRYKPTEVQSAMY